MSQFALTAEQRQLLRDPATFRTIRNAAVRGAREILPLGVADAAALREYQTQQITVRTGDGERSMERASVMTPPLPVMYSRLAERARFCETELVPTSPARWPGRRWSCALRNQ